MNLTASQIRQDLNCFGGFGQQGYGYNVQYLYNEIAGILGVQDAYSVIIIGGGNMGQAVARYANFKRRGFSIEAIFDVNPEVVGTTVNGMQVLHADDLEKYAAEHNVDIAVMTLPKKCAKEMVVRAAKAGIRGIWNFSSVDLHEEAEQYGLIVENVHLSDSLMVLGYRLHIAE